VNKLRNLEIVKLIKELDFIESDFNYKTELLKEMDKEFKKNLEIILENSPELKNIFTNSVDFVENKKIQNIITEKHEVELNEDLVIYEEKNSKLKSLFRTIVKKTHPDLSKDENFAEIYLQAKKAYEDNNLCPIISICDKLKIPFEIDDDEFNFMRNQVSTFKIRSQFLETTYTWQWYKCEDTDIKNQIIINFIRSQII
jgi:hypothetical protein